MKYLFLFLFLIPVVSADFKIEPEIFDLEINYGEIIGADLDVYNLDTTPTTLLVSYSSNFANAGPSSLELGPKEEKTVALNLDSSGMQPGIHDAAIYITDNSNGKRVQFKIDVLQPKVKKDTNYVPMIFLAVILVVEAFYLMVAFGRGSE